MRFISDLDESRLSGWNVKHSAGANKSKVDFIGLIIVVEQAHYFIHDKTLHKRYLRSSVLS
jgi:hypothetical protein